MRPEKISQRYAFTFEKQVKLFTDRLDEMGTSYTIEMISDYSKFNDETEFLTVDYYVSIIHDVIGNIDIFESERFLRSIFQQCAKEGYGEPQQ